ncbi:MAG: MFS transporter [Dehalococcoidales bacterium]|nr:MFS transporter [Dehalococcoidales bacterium]
MTDPFSRSILSLRRRVSRRFAPGIWTITVIGFLNAAGFSISLPFLSLYLYQQRGLSMTMVGIIILISGLGSAATQMVGGALSDRFGRRPLLLGAVITSAILYGVMAVFIAIDAGVLIIALTYIAGRAALMMMRPAISATVVDLSPKSQLTEAYGVFRIGQNLGWAAGPAIGGYLASVLPYGWLFGVAALMGVIAFAVIFFRLKESFGGTQDVINFRNVFAATRDSGFLHFIAICMLVFVVTSQMASTLSVYAVDRIGFSTVQYGLLLTLNGVIVVLLQYPVARWLDRISKPAALVIGSVLYGVGYFSFGLDTRFVSGLISMAIVTAGEITYSPVSQAVVGELSPPDWRGRYMGLFSLSETMGISLGPLLGGIILDRAPENHMAVWAAIAIVAFAAAVGFYQWGRMHPKSVAG